MRLYCCKCGKEVQAALVKGDVIYPHRPDLSQLNFYQCPVCKNYVGCHKGTKRALGCIPTKELRLARNKLHAKMDPLWKNKYARNYDICSWKLLLSQIQPTGHILSKTYS